MKNIFLKLALILGILLLSVNSAFAAKLAIVIGNSAYTNVGKLDNPINDAQLIANKFTSIGYEVRLNKNVDDAAFRKIIKELSRESDKYQVTVVYYAGHAVQVSGQNYLLSVNQEQPKTEEDIKFSSVQMDDLLNAIRSPLKIVLMDACRDNPLIQNSMVAKSRGLLSRGLAPPSQSSGGSFVAYATESGKVAKDGSGKNSPFAIALSDNLANQESIDDMFSRVTKQVLKLTNGDQRPYKYASLEEKFCLTGSCNSSKAVADKDTKNQVIEVLSNNSIVKIPPQMLNYYAEWVTYTFNEDFLYQISPKSFEYDFSQNKVKFIQKAVKYNKGLKKLFLSVDTYSINTITYNCDAETYVFSSVSTFNRDGTLINAFTYAEKDLVSSKVEPRSIGEDGYKLFCGEKALAFNVIPGVNSSGMVAAGADNMGSYWWNESGKLKVNSSFFYGVYNKFNNPFVEPKTGDKLESSVVIAKADCEDRKRAETFRRFFINTDQKIVGMVNENLPIELVPGSVGDNIMRLDCK